MSDRVNYPDRPLVPKPKNSIEGLNWTTGGTGENWAVRRAGWCPACKATLEECCCDEAGDPRELDFG